MRKPVVTCLAALCVAMSGCRDTQPMGASLPSDDPSRTLAAATTETGCLALEVSLSAAGAARSDSTSAACGALRILVAAPPRWDAATKELSLPLQVQNDGERAIRAPVRLLAWRDSVMIVSPRGLASQMPGRQLWSWLGSDSVAGAIDDASGSAWQLAADTSVIVASARSSTRTIRLSLHPGIRTIRLRLRVIAERVGTAVPGEAPDSIPAGLYDTANILHGSPYFAVSDKVVRGIVNIRFTAGASQRARQAAIDGVGGTVVGGMALPGVEGEYLVRVADDGSGLGMRTAIDRLNGDPSVSAAMAEYLHLPEEMATATFPRDGFGWRSWQTDRMAADGGNIGLEMISAPLAWGCGTGSPGTRIGVLDTGFYAHPDLLPNVLDSPHQDAYAGWLNDLGGHGAYMSSIIAARGNNDAGVTGVMWEARLREYDISVDSDGQRSTARFLGTPLPLLRLLRKRLREMLRTDARVINISMGTQGRFVRPRAQARQDVLDGAKGLEDVLREERSDALVVIAAGNVHRDAFWSTVPILAGRFPERTLVVAGVEEIAPGTGALWNDGASGGSAFNDSEALVPWDLVTIAAPARGIEGLEDNYGTVVADGTSPAAALVTGVAGLVASFDPRLSTREIRALVLEGARRAGHRVFGAGGEVYTLNAYESLRAAAERPGAPLCGNRMWSEGPALHVERLLPRSTGGTSPLVETVFSGFGSGLGFDAMHGGRAVRVFTDFGTDSLTWTPNGWTVRPAPFSFGYRDGSNASWLSSRGMTHDRARQGAIEMLGRNDPAVERIGVVVNGQPRGSFPLRPMQVSRQRTCVAYGNAERTHCIGEGVLSVGDSVSATFAMDPRGRAVYVAVGYYTTTGAFHGDFHPCEHYGGFLCSTYGYQARSAQTDIHRVDLTTSVATLLWSEPGTVDQIAVSEDGNELALRVATIEESVRTSLDPSFTRTRQYACTIQFRRLNGAAAGQTIQRCDRLSIAGFAS